MKVNLHTYFNKTGGMKINWTNWRHIIRNTDTNWPLILFLLPGAPIRLRTNSKYHEQVRPAALVEPLEPIGSNSV